jgi:uncharacterized phage protein (TIGR02220 family)
MSKRFTDTDKYKKPFVRGLQGAYKLLWDYLYHDCNHAGIWIVDFEVAQIYLGQDMPVNREDALRFFNDKETRVIEFADGGKWLIVPFIKFQYGTLNENNRVHYSVLSALREHGLVEIIKGLTHPLQGCKDKDKDKAKDKDKEKDSFETEDSLIDYLNEKSHSQYRHSKTSRMPIRARLNDGFALEDCRMVIDHQCKEWLRDSDMSKYLRPSTLFAASKFEAYLSAAGRGKVKKESRGFSITVRYSDNRPPEQYQMKDEKQLQETIEKMHLTPFAEREYLLDVGEFERRSDA